MKRLTNESIVGVVCVAMILLIAWAILANPQNTALGTLAGIVGGVVGGILLAIGLYVSQGPSFSVHVAEDKFNPALGGMYFIHVLVKNNATGFLGGGSAVDCRGVLRIGDATFVPKWASRPEPLSWHLVPVGQGQIQPVPWIDWSLMDECAAETLGPQEERMLDVAVKVEADRHVYIHEPQNYTAPQHKKNPYPPGTYHLTLTLKVGGRESKSFKIRLDNDDSIVADSVRLTME